MEILLLVVIVILVTILIVNKKKKESYSIKEFQENALKVVQENTFGIQPILNKQEQGIYYSILEILRDTSSQQNFTVFVQTTLGELLTHKENAKYRAIGCKRLDFCIVDDQFKPIIGIEYNGTGHHGNYSNLRDDIKRTALIEAGIKYICIDHGHISTGLDSLRLEIAKF